MLLAYLAVSCVLFLVARYWLLPFPVVTPPPRVHLWELQGGGGEQNGEGGEALGAKPEEWETDSGPEPLGPAVSQALPVHPSTCPSPIRATQTGELVQIWAPYLLPLSRPGLQPPALGERGGEEGGGKITLIKCPALPLAALASVLARTCHKVLSDRKQSLQVRSGEPVASVTQTREMASSAEGLALPQPGPVCENTAALLNGDRAGRLAAAGQDGEQHWQVVQS